MKTYIEEINVILGQIVHTWLSRHCYLVLYTTETAKWLKYD